MKQARWARSVSICLVTILIMATAGVYMFTGDNQEMHTGRKVEAAYEKQALNNLILSETITANTVFSKDIIIEEPAEGKNSIGESESSAIPVEQKDDAPETAESSSESAGNDERAVVDISYAENDTEFVEKKSAPAEKNESSANVNTNSAAEKEIDSKDEKKHVATESLAETEKQTDRETQTQAETEADTETRAETKTETKTETEAETKKAQPVTEPNAATKDNAEAALEKVDELEALPELEVEPVAKAPVTYTWGTTGNYIFRVEVKVTNNGSDTAKNVNVSVPLPDNKSPYQETTLKSVNHNIINTSGRVSTFNLGEIEPGETKTIIADYNISVRPVSINSSNETVERARTAYEQYAGSGNCRTLARGFISKAREIGINAREVIGYAHPSRGAMTSGSMDAFRHSWAEFYVDDLGWVPVDLTFEYFGELPHTSHIIESYSDQSLKVNFSGGSLSASWNNLIL